jgi:hypothetical protein
MLALACVISGDKTDQDNWGTFDRDGDLSAVQRSAAAFQCPAVLVEVASDKLN